MAIYEVTLHVYVQDKDEYSQSPSNPRIVSVEDWDWNQLVNPKGSTESETPVVFIGHTDITQRSLQ